MINISKTSNYKDKRLRSEIVIIVLKTLFLFISFFLISLSITTLLFQDFFNFQIVCIALVLSALFSILFFLFFKLRKSKEELEKSKIEIENFKNQINPHFLFNNLNNIYATILFDKEMALDYTRKFSDMMRFYYNMIGKELISFEEELEYIENYLAIEKYKVGERLTYTFTKNGEEESIQIPPLILSTLVETSIEKGQGLGGHFSIEINIDINEDSINLQVINSIPQQQGNVKKQFLIDKLDRRLQILYKNRYVLKFEKGTTYETTHLQLPIN